jgi:hypothetical protein
LPPIKPVLARDQSTILAKFGLVFQSLPSAVAAVASAELKATFKAIPYGKSLLPLFHLELGLDAFPQQPAGPEAGKGTEDGQGPWDICVCRTRGRDAEQAYVKRRVAARRVGIIWSIIPKCIQHGEAIADCIFGICGLVGVALCPPQCNSRTRLAIDEE